MSIELENPQTTLEKADAAANFVQQMMLAHMVGDAAKFKEVHKKASDLLFDVVQELDEQSDEA